MVIYNEFSLSTQGVYRVSGLPLQLCNNNLGQNHYNLGYTAKAGNAIFASKIIQVF
jgi:hypothetical protein